MKQIITMIVAVAVLTACQKQQDCQCRTVVEYSQWGTNMTDTWQTVGEWEHSDECRESETSTWDNFLTTTTRVECITQ